MHGFNLNLVLFYDRNEFSCIDILDLRGAIFTDIVLMMVLSRKITCGLAKIHGGLILSMDDSFRWVIRRNETGNRIH